MPTAFRKIEKNCENCGIKLILNNSRDTERKKFCSRKCLGIWGVKKGWLKCNFSEKTKQKMRESKIKLLKTGWKPTGWRAYVLTKRLSGRGYYFKGIKREHTLIAEKIIRRKLNFNEVVHHVDQNKLNNLPSNLQIMTRSEHIKLHLKLRKLCPRVLQIA